MPEVYIFINSAAAWLFGLDRFCVLSFAENGLELLNEHACLSYRLRNWSGVKAERLA